MMSRYDIVGKDSGENKNFSGPEILYITFLILQSQVPYDKATRILNASLNIF